MPATALMGRAEGPANVGMVLGYEEAVVAEFHKAKEKTGRQGSAPSDADGAAKQVIQLGRAGDVESILQLELLAPELLAVISDCSHARKRESVPWVTEDAAQANNADAFAVSVAAEKFVRRTARHVAFAAVAIRPVMGGSDVELANAAFVPGEVMVLVSLRPVYVVKAAVHAVLGLGHGASVWTAR